MRFVFPLSWIGVSLVISGLFVVWGGVVLIRTHDRPLVDISASQEPELALPVYAQFVVTQTLDVAGRHRISGVHVPVYVQDSSSTIDIMLRDSSGAIGSWVYPNDSVNQGIQEAMLVLPESVFVSGVVEVVFDGGRIPHEKKDTAPRLFVESFDGAYPNGNYRIAQNNKQGDVSLQLMEEMYGYELLWERFQENWMTATARMGVWVMVVFVVSQVPYAMHSFARSVERTTIGANR